MDDALRRQVKDALGAALIYGQLVDDLPVSAVRLIIERAASQVADDITTIRRKREQDAAELR